MKIATTQFPIRCRGATLYTRRIHLLSLPPSFGPGTVLWLFCVFLPSAVSPSHL